VRSETSSFSAPISRSRSLASPDDARSVSPASRFLPASMNSLDHTYYRLSAIPSRRHSSAIECSLRRPAITIRIFSQADYFLRVRRRISRTCCSAVPFGGVCFIGLILVPFNSDDEPKPLRYASTSDCPMGADGEQSVATRTGSSSIRGSHCQKRFPDSPPMPSKKGAGGGGLITTGHQKVGQIDRQKCDIFERH